MKQITIVIPTRNRSQLLIPLLKHIKKYYDDKFYDIIICDNSSSLQNKKKINLYLIKNFKNLKVFTKKNIWKKTVLSMECLKSKNLTFFLFI